ncbi:hypothetical protein ATI61_1277 [Archangium gephyra]|uniref:Uncharacterized protein n=1 Tax=Archangium gephyra TaxID=48 RepID=A0AAC8QJ45_9BACT|nr:hypothetical protein [Archangium gephyra]AKJ08384.1 Hypothetical protein AA314_10010 [Archangium gephyra]REG14288.1 hypothetical protein ATI61_1277 [Archangium gephyra]
MFRQTGQHSMTEQDPVCLNFARAGSQGQRARAESQGLPAFVSAAPPRSEGEALLRRIFSRGEQ